MLYVLWDVERYTILVNKDLEIYWNRQFYKFKTNEYITKPRKSLKNNKDKPNPNQAFDLTWFDWSHDSLFLLGHHVLTSNFHDKT